MAERGLELIRSMNAFSKAALALAGVAIVVGVWSLIPLIDAVLARSLRQQEAIEAMEGDSEYERMLAQYKRVIDERSVFFDPAPPEAPKEDPPPDNNREYVPPPPREYGGPDLIAIFADRAFFSGGPGNDPIEISEGETRSGVRLQRIEAPWYAHVRWSGADFRVNLFDESYLNSATGGQGFNFTMFDDRSSRSSGTLDLGGDQGRRGSPRSRPEGEVDLGLPQGEGLFIPVEEQPVIN